MWKSDSTCWMAEAGPNYDNPFGRNISLTEAVGMKPYTRYTVSSASSYVDAKIKRCLANPRGTRSQREP